MKIFKFIIIILISFTVNIYGTEISEDIVLDIQVDGIQRIEKETVISYSHITINEIYTEELGNNALKSLFETDLFSNI